MLRLLQLQLQGAGLPSVDGGFGRTRLEILEQNSAQPGKISLVITDLRLPGMDGLEFLKKVQSSFPSLPIIVMTAFGTRRNGGGGDEGRRQRLRPEALSLEDMMMTIDKVLELHALRDENIKLKTELGRRYDFGHIIGRSPNMQEVFDAASRVAPTATTVYWEARAAPEKVF